MKIKLTKEKKDLYFAKLLGRSDIYAQWSSPTEAIDNLIDCYRMVQDFRASQKWLEISTNYKTRLPQIDFSSSLSLSV
jgi:hypothetical protein